MNNIQKITFGKVIGFALALIGIIFANIVVDGEIPLKLQIGLVLWYTIFGAVIVTARIIFDNDLLITIKFPYRSIVIGAWLNFVIMLLAYDQLKQVMVIALGVDSLFASPWWFVLEGAVVGLFIDYLVMKLIPSSPR